MKKMAPQKEKKGLLHEGKGLPHEGKGPSKGEKAPYIFFYFF